MSFYKAVKSGRTTCLVVVLLPGHLCWGVLTKNVRNEGERYEQRAEEPHVGRLTKRQAGVYGVGGKELLQRVEFYGGCTVRDVAVGRSLDRHVASYHHASNSTLSCTSIVHPSKAKVCLISESRSKIRRHSYHGHPLKTTRKMSGQFCRKFRTGDPNSLK